MARTDIERTLLVVCETGVVPVFYHDDERVCREVASACYRSGLRAFEFTNRGAKALENFATLRKHITSNCPGMLLGAGTIFSNKSALDFINSGADFIVSPAFIPSMLAIQNVYNTLWIPGCATVSELAQARQLGITMMKIFPADLLGPKFIKAVLSVMPELRLMPTGGIEPSHQSLSSWFISGVSAVGIGSSLFSRQLIDHNDWATLEIKVREVRAIMDDIKAKQ
jgi:2-dehydro-3-deoxyphosphogluconate aldolase / (4S)-4-hydroxy-2-oxoglutarate aldolase